MKPSPTWPGLPESGAGRRRYGGAFGYDGRPGRCNPDSAGSKSIHPDSHYVLRGEVCVLLLRPVPGGGGFCSCLWDRRSYQMDVHNVREGVKEALLDLEEGADPHYWVKPPWPLETVMRQCPGGGMCAGGFLQRQRRIYHGEVRRPGRGNGRGEAHL